MSEPTLKMYHVHGDEESGWIVARTEDEAASIWRECVSDEEESIQCEEVPRLSLALVTFVEEDEPNVPRSMLTEFDEYVREGRTGYIAGTCS